MHEKERLGPLPSKERLDLGRKALGKNFKKRKMCLGGETVESNRERSRKVKYGSR